MPDVLHSALTTTDLHEPKGVSTATSNQTYVANGSGSGAWSEPEPKGASGANSGDVYIANGAGSGAWAPPVTSEYAAINTLESDSVSIPTIGTTAQTLPFSNDGPDNISVADSANNRLTLTNAGTYFVAFVISFSTTASGDAGEYEFKIQDDAVDTGIALKQEMSGSNDTGSATCYAFLTVGAGSHITVTVESDNGSNTDDIDIYYASLIASRMV
jgi:hypothetical protein